MASVSVVMATFNRASYIEEALDSLARQGRPSLEVIVVDDASTDDTRARVERHGLGSRIRYRLQPANQGASVARNVGVEMARGDVIVFLDSDDILEPSHHAVMLEVMRSSPSVGLFSCDARMIDPSGQPLDSRTYTEIQGAIKGWRPSTGRRSLADIFRFSTSFPGMAVRRDVYLRLGGLDQALFPLDDYDLQLRVAGAGHGVHYEHQTLARYRVHGANESGPARGVRVGRQKLRCVQQARARYPELDAVAHVARRRLGEVKRELALSLLKDGGYREGAALLCRSLAEDPAGWADLLRIAGRRVRRWGGTPP